MQLNPDLPLLGVNIDHIATLRQARGTRYPDPVQAALISEQAGADAITIHLREDRRHIQDRDVRVIAEVLATRMNLELAITAEMLEIACDVKPHDCCLVPERREELTTEGGLDVAGHIEAVRGAVARLAENEIRTSLFIDPDERQIEAAVKAGAPVIELHTGAFADADNERAAQAQLDQLSRAVELASDMGLLVNAGHGLHYHNVQPVAAMALVNELNIGHAIIARALFSGLAAAVTEMKQLLRLSRR